MHVAACRPRCPKIKIHEISEILGPPVFASGQIQTTETFSFSAAVSRERFVRMTRMCHVLPKSLQIFDTWHDHLSECVIISQQWNIKQKLTIRAANEVSGKKWNPLAIYEAETPLLSANAPPCLMND